MPFMRIAVGALVLLNVLIFGWLRMSDSKPTLAVSAPQLTALKLVPAQALSLNRCMSLGPFTDPTTLNAPAAALASRGFVTRSRRAEHSVSGGWWVYVGGLSAAQQRQQAIARLRRANVKEVAEISFGAGDERISAGIFSDHERALRIAELVKSALLIPTVEERLSTASDWWLDADIKRESALPAVATLVAATPATAALGWSDCPPAAGGR